MFSRRRRDTDGYDAREVANWFIRRSVEDKEQGPKTQLQLLKLVYFAHAWMLGMHGRPLSKQAVEAWKYGPVVPDVYHALKAWKREKVTKQIAGYECGEDFDDQATDILEQAYDLYGPLYGYQLSDITHRPDSPWFVTRTTKFPSSEISNDLIQDFFSQEEVDA